MVVKVLSKLAFDSMIKNKGVSNSNVEEYKNTFFISIINTGNTKRIEEQPILKDAENVKVMCFDDVIEDIDIPIIGQSTSINALAMTYLQAEELVSFIMKHKDKKSCIVHCSAGISRSGAVGTFINDIYGIKHEEFIKNNPYIQSNMHVYLLLKKAYRYCDE
jgi:predicted protein tyrosine phosphatase